MSSNNTYFTLAALKASPTTEGTAFLVSVPAIDDGTFFWTLGDFTGQDDDLNIIFSGSDPTGANGAWVRQSADAVAFQQTGADTRIRRFGEKAAERVSLLDFEGVDPLGATDSAAGIIAAIENADATGRTLIWPRVILRIESTIFAGVSKVDWVCEGTVLDFQPASDQAYGLNIECGIGVDHKILGTGLRINANGKAHRAMRFHQPLGDQTANFYAERLAAENVEMQVGTAMGSAGVMVGGGWNKVELVETEAREIMMRADAGVIGTRGVTGILVLHTHAVAGSYARNVLIRGPRVHRVYSQDPDHQYDMDGIGVFANPDIDISGGLSSLRIEASDISSCWGRDIKTQVGWASIDNPKSVRDEGPNGGFVNAAYDFQTGSAMLMGGDYTIDGVDCTVLGGLCRFSVVAVTAPMMSQWIGGHVRIINGASVDRLAMHDPGTSPTPATTLFRGQTVNGEIREFAWIRTNGYDIDVCKVEDGAFSSIVGSLFRVETRGGGASPYRAITRARDCTHLGVPIGLTLGNIPGNAAQILPDQSGCQGFIDPPASFVSTVTTATSGAQQTDRLYPVQDQAGVAGGAMLSGSLRLLTRTLAAGTQEMLPAHGFNGTYFAEVSMSKNAGTHAKVAVGSGLETVFAGSNAQVSASTDPGSGDLRIWRSGSSLVIKNGDSVTRTFFIVLTG